MLKCYQEFNIFIKVYQEFNIFVKILNFTRNLLFRHHMVYHDLLLS